MSPIKNLILIGALIVSTLMISGCGSSTPNSKATNDHQAAGWLPAGHMNAAKANQDSCTECHGSDFSGGISGVACTQCHLGGVDSVHPVEWGTKIFTLHQDYVALHGTSTCANAACHGLKLQGVANSGPECSTCH